MGGSDSEVHKSAHKEKEKKKLLALSPIAKPLAGKKLSKRTLKLIRKGFRREADLLPSQSQIDTSEIQSNLEKLYISTRSAKHFQRDIVHGVEGFIVIGSKQVEIGIKLSEDSRKYGAENTCTSGSALSKAAMSYSSALIDIERERENLLKSLGTQDARCHAQRYDRVRQEAEAQVIEVTRRQAKVRESSGNPDNLSKFEAAQARLHEVKSNMTVLDKEVVATMSAVEAPQQILTLQRLISMVEAEKHHHQKVLNILDRLEVELSFTFWHFFLFLVTSPMSSSPSHDEINGVFASERKVSTADNTYYFLGEVIHPYQSESDADLSLTVGDYVVVQKVSSNGWAEGECQGKAGWFPFEYVERQQNISNSFAAK
ncbi:hypothetical protein L2E82_14676 [Cichorium intybus]|uniref:Uncharacterized protein n=1 Tax=Cichorium intybus TaxID=13427 RepID=A0ACB9F137_CICIN|nr:hypothetical protein L2E82_14676 [Cichorium intybus]